MTVDPDPDASRLDTPLDVRDRGVVQLLRLARELGLVRHEEPPHVAGSGQLTVASTGGGRSERPDG